MAEDSSASGCGAGGAPVEAACGAGGLIGPWRLARGREIALDGPRLMGILNATPDSFFGGSRETDPARAAARAGEMFARGASIVDIGGESTRPGAARVGAVEQIARVLPIVRAIRRERGLDGLSLSVDTTSAEVARAALEEGCDAVNDVSAGIDDPAMFGVIAGFGAGLILMHRVTAPERDSYSDRYVTPPMGGDVVGRVREFLRERRARAEGAGVARGSIVLDPGLGFGKSVGQNVELIRRTGELLDLGSPILSALSRKSFIGRVAFGDESAVEDRLSGTLAASMAHFAMGVRLFRVHDVGAHREAFGVLGALGWGGAFGSA